MAGSSIKEVKEVKLNPPKPFTRKRTDLNRFLQDIFVYLFINNNYYDTDVVQSTGQPGVSAQPPAPAPVKPGIRVEG